MEIYILRHGIAENQRPGHSDAERSLTGEGRDKLRLVLGRAREAEVLPSLILTSPLIRAVQTAEIAGEILGYQQKIIRTEALLPSSAPHEVWEEIRGRRNETGLLLAGHEPQLSQLVAFLLGTAALQVDMKKGALVRIDVDQFSGNPRGVLKWMLTPKLAA